MDIIENKTPEYVKRRDYIANKLDSFYYFLLLPYIRFIFDLIIPFKSSRFKFDDMGLKEYYYKNLVQTYLAPHILVPYLYGIVIVAAIIICGRKCRKLLVSEYTENGLTSQAEARLMALTHKLKMLDVALILTLVVRDICYIIETKDFSSAVLVSITGVIGPFQAFMGIMLLINVRKAEKILQGYDNPFEKKKEEVPVSASQRKAYGIVAVLMGVCLVGAFGRFMYRENGNPITRVKIKSDAKSYVLQNRPDLLEDAKISDVSFDYYRKKYYINVERQEVEYGTPDFHIESLASFVYDSNGNMLSNNLTTRFCDTYDLFNYLENDYDKLLRSTREKYLNSKNTEDFDGYSADILPVLIDKYLEGSTNFTGYPDREFDLNGDDKYIWELQNEYCYIQVKFPDAPVDAEIMCKLAKKVTEVFDDNNFPYRYVNIIYGKFFDIENNALCMEMTREELHSQNLKEILLIKRQESRDEINRAQQ